MGNTLRKPKHLASSLLRNALNPNDDLWLVHRVPESTVGFGVFQNGDWLDLTQDIAEMFGFATVTEGYDLLARADDAEALTIALAFALFTEPGVAIDNPAFLFTIKWI